MLDAESSERESLARSAEKRLLARIANEQATVDDVAAAYAVAARHSPREVDWAVVNAAIVRRLSKNALRYITGRVWQIDISRLPAEFFA